MQAVRRQRKFGILNVVEFVERILPLILTFLGKGPLHFRFFDASEGQIPAYVTYQPLMLHMDQETWELARIGEPEARFIVAHEICHILDHDHHAQAFSDDPTLQLKFAQKEERAEWQANTFASYFLLPPQVLESIGSVDQLVTACAVPRRIAVDRSEAAAEEKRRTERCARARSYLGDACTKCGNFTLLPLGIDSQCDTCGYKHREIAAT